MNLEFLSNGALTRREVHRESCDDGRADARSVVDVPGVAVALGSDWRLDFVATSSTLEGRYFGHVTENGFTVSRREADVPVTTPGESTPTIQVNIDLTQLVFDKQ
jgi:hypothetical protein